MLAGARRPFSRVVLALLVVLIAACSSGSSTTTATRTSTSVPTTRPKAQLEFREALYGPGGSPLIFPATLRPCARLGKRSSSATREVGLVDRKHQYRYFAGPVLVTGAGIDSATVTYDSTVSLWAVDVHWHNDDFLTKIAAPLIGKQVVIVLNGVVQSAPTVQPGITGHDVEITSGYSRADAIKVAASIMGVVPSRVRVDANGA